MNHEPIDRLASPIWDFCTVSQDTHTADAIIVLGCMDLRVIDRAAELWKRNATAPIIAAGGTCRLSGAGWNQPEARVMADYLVRAGVPESTILIDDQSTNVSEKIRNSLELLTSRELPARELQLVCMPAVVRRVNATCLQQIPYINTRVTAPAISYLQYPDASVSYVETINILAGEIFRLQAYAAQGFIPDQQIPPDLVQAANRLDDAGFNKYHLW